MVRSRSSRSVSENATSATSPRRPSAPVSRKIDVDARQGLVLHADVAEAVERLLVGEIAQRPGMACAERARDHVACQPVPERVRLAAGVVELVVFGERRVIHLRPEFESLLSPAQFRCESRARLRVRIGTLLADLRCVVVEAVGVGVVADGDRRIWIQRIDRARDAVVLHAVCGKSRDAQRCRDTRREQSRAGKADRQAALREHTRKFCSHDESSDERAIETLTAVLFGHA